MLAISQTLQTPKCSHIQREYLGADYPAEFYRCEMCGAVLVVQGRKAWRLSRPVGSA
ncbi:MAG TPA: hypothetical protein VJN63_10750 [Thermoplasmata archaeon]|nr:hypothetical protein [Thermoplasmata archaeon]